MPPPCLGATHEPRGQPRASGRGVWSGGWPSGLLPGLLLSEREHRPLRACWRHRAASGLDGKEGTVLDLERVPVGAVDTRRAEEQLGERHAVDSGDLLAGPVVPHTPRVRLHGEGSHLRRRRLGQLRAAPLPCYPQRAADATRCGAAKHGDEMERPRLELARERRGCQLWTETPRCSLGLYLLWHRGCQGR